MFQTQLIGHAGRSCETSYTPSGKYMAVTSLAVRPITAANGEPPVWVRVVAFGKMAELLEKHARTGTYLFVQGKLSVEAYLSKSNEPKASITVFVDQYTILHQPANKPEEVQQLV